MTQPPPSDSAQSGPQILESGAEIDSVDRQILCDLFIDARNMSSRDISDKVDVTPATIRNRIDRLEQSGVIREYRPVINYQVLGRFRVLFICTTGSTSSKLVAEHVDGVPNVVQTRVLLSGKGDLHVVGTVTGTDTISRLENKLSEFDLEVEDISLIAGDEASLDTEIASSEGTDGDGE